MAFLIQIDSANAEAATGLIERMSQRATAIVMVSNIPASMKMASGNGR